MIYLYLYPECILFFIWKWINYLFLNDSSKDWNDLVNKNYKYFLNPFGTKFEYIFAMEKNLHEKLKESAGSAN